MPSWFYDVSNHQSSTPNLDGWDGLLVKASEGSDFKDGRFRQHMDVAQKAGKFHAGYHFLRSDSSVKEQAANFMSVCPKEIAAVPDVEWIKDKAGNIVSAPTLGQTREFIDRLQQAGYYVPMQYLPRWYWNFWGNPDLVGLPPLWVSYYPDYIARPRDEAWKQIPASAKSGFGGLSVVAVQFTSTPLDQNRSEFSPQEIYDFFSTTRRIDMPLNAEADWEPFKYMMTRWWVFHSRQTGSEFDQGLTAPEMLGIIAAKQAADVDEVALAEELAKHGVGDVDITKVKTAFAEVLAGTRLTPPTPPEE
jgi:Glycosyl hydrolases family 25